MTAEQRRTLKQAVDQRRRELLVNEPERHFCCNRTAASYRKGCHCPDCRAAAAKARREYDRRHPGSAAKHARDGRSRRAEKLAESAA